MQEILFVKLSMLYFKQKSSVKQVVSHIPIQLVVPTVMART